jgi:Tfp pilus assembly protein PilF
MSRLRASLWFLIAIPIASGCTSNPPSAGGLQTGVDPARDTASARRHNDAAMVLLERGNLEGAEKELEAALKSDTTFGPAHNNLGLTYYRQKKLYKAAQEFQAAAALLPGKAEPRNNLGLVLELPGRLEEAAKAYEEALAADPSFGEATANLARVYVRLNRNDARTRQLLQDIVMKDPRPQWAAWARERLVLMVPTTSPTTVPDDSGQAPEADAPSTQSSRSTEGGLPGSRLTENRP